MAKKKVATKAEREHLRLVAQINCLICQRPAICHHIRNLGDGKGNIGISQRANHYQTIPLCPDHHTGKFSIHNCKQEFEAMYGTEHEMLRKTLKEIENIEEANNFFNYNNGENNG